MPDEINRKPRRRIVMIAKIEADDWPTLRYELEHLAREIARHGKAPASSVSGGYSCGHIVVTSEDGSIDHDSWAVELNRYLEALAAAEAKTPAAFAEAAIAAAGDEQGLAPESRPNPRTFDELTAKQLEKHGEWKPD